MSRGWNRGHVGERGGHRGIGVHALLWAGPLQEPSCWGHGEKVEEAGRRLKKNQGALGTLATSGCGGTWDKGGGRQRRGQKLAPKSVGAAGKDSGLAGVTGEGMWLPRAGEPRASGSVPPTCVME